MVWVDLYQREGIFRPKNKINDCLKTFFSFKYICYYSPHTHPGLSKGLTKRTGRQRIFRELVSVWFVSTRQTHIAPWLNLNINCHLPVKTEQDNGATRKI